MDFKLLRFLCSLFAGLFIFVSSHSALAQVPVTVDDNVDLFGTGVEVFSTFSDAERNTCDPEFWDVVKDRAWMEAQREVTQNWNIVAKPDSVMALGCFDDHMNRLATYGHNHFPYKPDESAGDLSPGTFNDISMIARVWIAITLGYQNVGTTTELGYEAKYLLAEAIGQEDPVLAGGVIPYTLLELLVLDQLVRGVTPCGAILDTTDYPAAAVACNLARSSSPPPGSCVTSGFGAAEYNKMGFLEHNFDDLALGGRATAKSATPAPSSSFSAINVSFGSSVSHSTSNLSNCQTMGQVWERARCYDFAMESTTYNQPDRYNGGSNQDTSKFPPTLNYGSVSSNHDGFYRLSRYNDVATSNSDFRTKFGACGPPKINDPSDLVSDIPTDDFACWIFEHGLPFTNISSLSTLLSSFSAFIPPPGDSPIWSTAHDGANPEVGDAGSADQFIDYLNLRGKAVPQTPTCADPIKSGYIVTNTDGTEYEDAFCPTPGCWFVPPSSVGANGTCTQ